MILNLHSLHGLGTSAANCTGVRSRQQEADLPKSWDPIPVLCGAQQTPEEPVQSTAIRQKPLDKFSPVQTTRSSTFRPHEVKRFGPTHIVLRNPRKNDVWEKLASCDILA